MVDSPHPLTVASDFLRVANGLSSYSMQLEDLESRFRSAGAELPGARAAFGLAGKRVTWLAVGPPLDKLDGETIGLAEMNAAEHFAAEHLEHLAERAGRLIARSNALPEGIMSHSFPYQRWLRFLCEYRRAYLVIREYEKTGVKNKVGWFDRFADVSAHAISRLTLNTPERSDKTCRVRRTKYSKVIELCLDCYPNALNDGFELTRDMAESVKAKYKPFIEERIPGTSIVNAPVTIQQLQRLLRDERHRRKHHA